ncbi:hypothetical protein BDA96_03G108900 [Sorghum bicolor]|uniref:Uncharacterized protein n=1 Tax=Sorghum bicolor TaxID=4558 RepID=A0A921RDF0_SORBI|nr:hypothetical protein BDA96_03G108900 [Sorghum bicolor]
MGRAFSGSQAWPGPRLPSAHLREDTRAPAHRSSEVPCLSSPSEPLAGGLLLVLPIGAPGNHRAAAALPPPRGRRRRGRARAGPLQDEGVAALVADAVQRLALHHHVDLLARPRRQRRAPHHHHAAALRSTGTIAGAAQRAYHQQHRHQRQRHAPRRRVRRRRHPPPQLPPRHRHGRITDRTIRCRRGRSPGPRQWPCRASSPPAAPTPPSARRVRRPRRSMSMGWTSAPRLALLPSCAVVGATSLLAYCSAGSFTSSTMTAAAAAGMFRYAMYSAICARPKTRLCFSVDLYRFVLILRRCASPASLRLLLLSCSSYYPAHHMFDQMPQRG